MIEVETIQIDEYLAAVNKFADATVRFDQAFQLAKSQATEKKPVTDAAAAAYANDMTNGDVTRTSAEVSAACLRMGFGSALVEYRR